jgi:homoserine dehydrogenase
MIQRGGAAPEQGGGDVVNIIMVTHEGPERCVSDALERLMGSQSLAGEPMLMHILDL